MKHGDVFPHEPSQQQSVDERIREIEAHHQALDDRLRELHSHAHMTPEEQVEAAQIKKAKLKAKDELAALRRSPPA